jgi:hypothetical protein
MTRREATWMGYTFTELHQMAGQLAVHCPWGGGFAFPDKFEFAWAGIVDYLAGCETPPERFEMYKAGMKAISRAADRELREHGVTTRGGDGLRPTTRFEIYWRPRAAPGADTAVVDRLAVHQIWPMLRPLHQMAFLALAAHGDYAQAAQAVGYPYSTFSDLVSQARAAFLTLWHEGEAPSRIWAVDKHGHGDITERARRVLAARRSKTHPRPRGPKHDKERDSTQL